MESNRIQYCAHFALKPRGRTRKMRQKIQRKIYTEMLAKGYKQEEFKLTVNDKRIKVDIDEPEVCLSQICGRSGGFSEIIDDHLQHLKRIGLLTKRHGDTVSFVVRLSNDDISVGGECESL